MVLNGKNKAISKGPVLLLIAFPLISPGAEQGLREDDWRELTRELDYGDIESEQQAVTEEKADKSSFKLNPKILNVVVISAAIILLVILLMRILGVNPLSKKLKASKKSYSLEDAEHDLEQAELLPILDEFLRKGDFRSALRARYLLALRDLNENGLINWKREKTNFDYVRELGGTYLKDRFGSLTLAFELVWYGERQIDAAFYTRLAAEFDAFTQLIPTQE